MIPRLQEKYQKEILPQLKEQFGIKNTLAAPRLQKIILNMGVGDAIHDIKIMEDAVGIMTRITGQKPIVCRSRIAISNFKLRKGMPVGCKVTLRRERMYEFLDRLINVCFPRIRDFNGISTKSFDKFGNYSLGITDQAIFPEINSADIRRAQGMEITFVFNNKPKEQTFELLKLMGMPFHKTNERKS